MWLSRVGESAVYVSREPVMVRVITVLFSAARSYSAVAQGTGGSASLREDWARLQHCDIVEYKKMGCGLQLSAHFHGEATNGGAGVYARPEGHCQVAYVQPHSR